MSVKSRAIVLKKVAYGESDWIVTLFTRDLGRISGIARGARASKRRFGGALEIGSVVDVRYNAPRSGTLVRIDEAQVVSGTVGVMKSLERIGAMTRALDLALAFLQEHQVATDKFELLVHWLENINMRDPSPQELLFYELGWLSLCGYRPHIESCVACGEAVDGEKSFAFDFEQGGMICAGCCTGRAKRVILSHSAREYVRCLALGEDADDNHAPMIGNVIDRYIEHLLGRPLRVGPQVAACMV